MQPSGGSIINLCKYGILPSRHTIRFTARVKVHWWHLLKASRSVIPRIVYEVFGFLEAVENTRMMNRDLESTGDYDTAYPISLAASPMAKAEGRMIDVDEVAAAVLCLCQEMLPNLSPIPTMPLMEGKSLGIHTPQKQV